MITLAMLQAVAPKTPRADLEKLLPHLNAAAARWGIDTSKRQSGWLAQCSHESMGFTRRAENLNYSAERLCAVWPSRFPNVAAAQPYARNPEKLANRVYANRMGNGSPETGDGWRYRGAGFKQLTGKDNHTAFAKAVGKPLKDIPAYLLTDEGACQSAGWFWASRNLNRYADSGDIRTMTLKVNGGTLGLKERTALFGAACKACGLA